MLNYILQFEILNRFSRSICQMEYPKVTVGNYSDFLSILCLGGTFLEYLIKRITLSRFPLLKLKKGHI